MAAISAETQAIIDRLKAEGDLVRNSGTNSVRSVKLKLDKFEGIFNTISNNVVEQTELMRLQLGQISEQVERQKAQEQFDEIEPPSAPEVEKTNNPQEETDKTIDKISDSIASSLSLKNIAMAAGGGFVFYNLLKGFVNESTGGGFDKMTAAISGMDWDGMKTKITDMTDGLDLVNWSNFSTAINNASTAVNSFTKWLGDTGVSDIVSTVVGGGLVTAGAKGAISGALAKSGGGVGMAGRLAAIGPGIALAAAGVAIYYGDEIKNWITEQTGAESPEAQDSIANLVTVGQAGMSAMSIAMMFGPHAMLATAAATVAVGLGVLIHGWIKKHKRQEAEKFEADVDTALEKARAEAEAGEGQSDETTEALARAMAEARRRTQLAIGDEARKAAEEAKNELEAALAQNELGDGTEGVNRLQLDRIQQDVMSGKEGSIDELFAWAEGREKETADNWFRFSSKEDFIRDMVEGLRPDISNFDNSPEGMAEWRSAQDAWDAKAQQILEERGYRTGTGGFKDFGSGTTAILHGKEAVVPLNSPEGQILKNLFNGPTPADVVTSSGGANGGGIVQVNNNSTPNYITNISNGGDTVAVSQNSFGGGGGSPTNFYNIPAGVQ